MRWFFMALIGGGLVVFGGYYFGFFTIIDPLHAEVKPVAQVKEPVGDWLYPRVPVTYNDFKEKPGMRDPIVQEDAIINIYDKQEVASYKEGIMLFLGERIDPANPLAGIQLQQATVIQGGKEIVENFRRWYEGDIVKQGQMLALIDPAQALNKVASTKEKIEATKSELVVAELTSKEADTRYERAKILFNKGAIGAEEYSAAALAQNKYRWDVVAKKAAVKVADVEADEAMINLRQHEIRSTIPGNSLIKVIYKQRGEGVKPLEPVVQLHNISRLRAEGFVDGQYQAFLRKGQKVMVEPTTDMPPERVYKHHRDEVTGVAICNDKNAANPRFVSSSLDGTVIVRRRDSVVSLAELTHPSGVTAIACSPAGSGKNLCIAGCADGSVHIWDLDNLGEPGAHKRVFEPVKNAHRAPITAIAFSPKGDFFATGGQDNLINLWTTAEGKVKYPFDADHGVAQPHQGAVTSLHFTQQSQLVSAARDNTLRVWLLKQDGAQEAYAPISGRSGAVGKLGVSADGRFMLFDQGKTLQIRSVQDGKHICNLKNNFNANGFDTLSIISPDSKLILSAGAPEGRLQLWKAPSYPGERGYEVRQLVNSERASATCAAFGKGEAGFAISGAKDGSVYVWQMPTEQDIDAHRITKDAQGQDLRLTLVERQLEAGKVRVAVDLDNPETPQFPQGRLVPGRRVTLVIQPE